MRYFRTLPLVLALINFLFIISKAQFSNGQPASGLIGQQNYSASAANHPDSLGFVGPSAIAIDPKTGIVYVADAGNNRVLRFKSSRWVTSSSGAEGVLGQPDFSTTVRVNPPTASSMYQPSGIALDTMGNLYVADFGNNRVLKFSDAASKPNGAAADLVLGQMDFVTCTIAVTQRGMNGPSGVVLDNTGNLYVVDQNNHRILKFSTVLSKSNGDPANGVLGQSDFTTATHGTAVNKLEFPFHATIDEDGNLYVADTYNNRVLRFSDVALKVIGASADIVLGQSNFTSSGDGRTQGGMSQPRGVTVDKWGNLYVGDGYNNRVLKFSHVSAKGNGAMADTVLGQDNFTTAQFVTAQNRMRSPRGVVVDGLGSLYVADFYSNRILKFFHASEKGNGADANAVLGQYHYTASGQNRIDSLGMKYPQSIAVDPTTGALYLADVSNHRVLRYASYASYQVGDGAVGVLGQSDFYLDSVLVPPTAYSMNEPWGVAVDGAGNLYVADHKNSRILRFSNAASKPNGANADAVLGQLDFTSYQIHANQTGMYFPSGIAVDGSGNLYVTDFMNNRVLIFLNAASKANGAPADIVLGQPNYTSTMANITSTGMYQPNDVAVDGDNTLYVADTYNNRILKFSNVTSKANGDPANVVLGQTTFTSNTAALSQSGMYRPTSIDIDGIGNLYVADTDNNRIVIFMNAGSKANGAPADGVLGQDDFISSVSGTTQSKMNSPKGVAVNTEAGILYAIDYNNHRILMFDNGSPLPVEMISFTVTIVNMIAELRWSTATEINNYGFEVERRYIGNGEWEKIGFIQGHGTSAISQYYCFSDNMCSSVRRAYRLKQIDQNGSFKYSQSVEVEGEMAPERFTLLQNYPNPFNPTTIIKYTVPVVGTRHAVSLRIYDMLGREVATLVNEIKPAGSYQIPWNTNGVASGTYFYQLKTGSSIQTKKMILFK